MPKISFQNEISLCIRQGSSQGNSTRHFFGFVYQFLFFAGKELPSFILTDYRWLRSAGSKKTEN